MWPVRNDNLLDGSWCFWPNADHELGAVSDATSITSKVLSL